MLRAISIQPMMFSRSRILDPYLIECMGVSASYPNLPTALVLNVKHDEIKLVAVEHHKLPEVIQTATAELRSADRAEGKHFDPYLVIAFRPDKVGSRHGLYLLVERQFDGAVETPEDSLMAVA